MNSLQGKVCNPLEKHSRKSLPKAQRRKRYLKNQPSKSYRICARCRKKIDPQKQWGRRWKDKFYHKACLFELLRETHTVFDIEEKIGSNYGVIFTDYLKSGF